MSNSVITRALLLTFYQMALHNVDPIPQLTALESRLWDYQDHGVAKILHCWKTKHKSCILADEMGLGKTIQALAACMQDEDTTPASFSLVVTTKSCVRQWANQIDQHFSEAKRPKYLVLDSSKQGAVDLIKGKYDFVICSYGFVQAQHRRLLSHQDFLNKVRLLGQAYAEKTTNLRFQKRPRLSLFSDLYTILGLPIRHLILDEAQYIKNWETGIHKAIKGLVYTKFLAITGTPITNRWWDVYGIISLMKDTPLPTPGDFWRVFGNQYHRRGEPPPSKLPRLIKFLMMMTVSRPASLMELPGLEIKEQPLELKAMDEDMVLIYTKLFLDTLRKRGHSTNNQNFRTAGSAKRALIWATRAQQFAAHPQLVDNDTTVDHKNILTDITKMRIGAMKVSESTDKRQLAQDLLTMFEAKAEAEVEAKVEAEAVNTADDNEDEDTTDDADYDPNKGLLHDDDDEEDEEDGEIVEDDVETNTEKRKQWIKKVRQMDDQALASNRLDSICHVCTTIQKKTPGARITIFSRFLRFLDLIGEALHRRLNVIALRLDGTCSKDERQGTTQAFSANPGSILLVTPRTGGAGLNGLECASQLIQCEPWWTAAEEAQVYARLSRPKQEKVVHIHYSFAINSAIDHLVERIRNGKSETNEKIIGPLRRKDDEAPNIPTILEQY